VNVHNVVQKVAQVLPCHVLVEVVRASFSFRLSRAEAEAYAIIATILLRRGIHYSSPWMGLRCIRCSL